MSPTPDLPSGGAPATPDWAALARYLDGESDAVDAARVDAWLAAHPGDAALLEALAARVGPGSLATPLPDVDVESALARVTRLRDKDPTRLSTWRGVPSVRLRPRWQVPAMAAAAALVLAAALYVMRDASPPDALDVATAPLAAYETGAGQRGTHRLPDGSTVMLGPRSQLLLRRFDDRARVVELRGEAHFVAAHDAARPFTVRAGGATIVDIGTAFTVRADESRTRVAVTEGVVELRAGAATPGTGVVLRRGDVGTLGEGGAAHVQRGALAAADTAWMQGRLVFDETPVTEVARELERWYGVRVVIADSALAARRFSGTYESARRAIDDISLALGARLEVRGDTAILRR